MYFATAYLWLYIQLHVLFIGSPWPGYVDLCQTNATQPTIPDSGIGFVP